MFPEVSVWLGYNSFSTVWFMKKGSSGLEMKLTYQTYKAANKNIIF